MKEFINVARKCFINVQVITNLVIYCSHSFFRFANDMDLIKIFFTYREQNKLDNIKIKSFFLAFISKRGLELKQRICFSFMYRFN